jgi:hypothetical protein
LARALKWAFGDFQASRKFRARPLMRRRRKRACQQAQRLSAIHIHFVFSFIR